MKDEKTPICARGFGSLGVVSSVPHRARFLYLHRQRTGLRIGERLTSGARYYANAMVRFMSPYPLGGHMEDPQTLNKYVYVRNNPLSLTDPTGLDFYLQCQSASSSCASQTVGFDKNGVAQIALVRGVTNSDKSFTATQIGNDGNGGLVDKTTGTGSYSANVSGSGVQFSPDGGKTSVRRSVCKPRC